MIRRGQSELGVRHDFADPDALSIEPHARRVWHGQESAKPCELAAYGQTFGQYLTGVKACL
jgi:hypothetical protein